MTRKKVTLEYIVNDNSRRASLKKRREGLKKKVKDLTTLCDVFACVIIYSENEDEPFHFPESRHEVEMVLERFERVPEMDRRRKKHDHETYSASRVFKLRDQIAKKTREYQELQMSIYLHDICWFLKQYDQFSPVEFSSLCQYLRETWRECMRRIQHINQANEAGFGCEYHLSQDKGAMQQAAAAPWDQFQAEFGLPQHQLSNNISHLSQGSAYIAQGMTVEGGTTGDYELPPLPESINNDLDFMQNMTNHDFMNQTPYRPNYDFDDGTVGDPYRLMPPPPPTSGDGSGESFAFNFTLDQSALAPYDPYNGAVGSQVFGSDSMTYDMPSSYYGENMRGRNCREEAMPLQGGVERSIAGSGDQDYQWMQPYLNLGSDNMACTETLFSNPYGGSGDGMMQLSQGWEEIMLPQLDQQGGDAGRGYGAPLSNQEWNNCDMHLVHQGSMI